MPRTHEQFEEIRKEKKQLILNIALKLFANQGYTSTSISRIAQEAKISKGLLYNYFDSKEDLLRTIIISFINEMIKIIDPTQDNVIDDEEALNMLDYIFEMIKNRKEFLLRYHQLAFQPEVMKIMMEETLSDTYSKYALMISEYFAKKHPQDAYLWMMNLSNILKGFILQYVFLPEMFSDELLEQYKEHLKDMFIRN